MTIRVEDLALARVLVVGDVMLDRYWYGSSDRISPEAPVPVVRVDDETERPGGAANVAANVAALGAEATLIGVVGNDPAADRLEALARKADVTACLLREAGWTTPVKLRVVSQHQQLLRADFETDPESIDQDRLANEVRVRSASSTVVILSDYGKGTLQDPQALIAIARSNDVRVVVDPKGRDFAKYHGAYLLTPNLAEFEAVAGGCNGEQDLEARARRLCEQEKIAAILITRGAHGLSLIPVDGAAVHLRTDARDVFDVTGAGDTVCAVIGTALAVGMGVRDALTLANTAAGIVVGKLGTATVSSEELASALSRLPRSAVGLIAEPELLACVREARQRGERIVMTNGCFDILHAGHVTYLQQAAALGDRLVVAINSDASVRRLKGADRPINRLADRATVLGGLAALDWVVAFDADTPEELIAKIQPDVLVKGGDYRIEEIAGAESVLAGGGEVRTLPIVAGLSTSTILAAGAGEHGGGDA